MVKPIILAGSCKKNRDAGCLDAIRQTWAKSPSMSYMFFLGTGCAAPQNDELVFGFPDGYFDQNAKHQAALAWALSQGFTHVFLADDDTYIDTGRLFSSGFEAHDYVGNAVGTPRRGQPCGVDHDYCHGGPGYWLSKRACQVIVDAPFDLNRPEHRIDDQWIGLALKEAGILPVHDPRYSLGTSYHFRQEPVLASNANISCHLSKIMGVYKKEWMIDAHRARCPGND